VTPEHWFKPAEDMRKLFADLPEACDNTLDIARRCAFMVHKRDPILPSFPTGDGRSEPEELTHQAREGLKMRLAPGAGRRREGSTGTARLRARRSSSRWASPATS
jgi:DNA polymerase-3 subunit alpha